MVTRLHDLPDEVRLTLQTFLQDGGGIAEAEGLFNPTDTWIGHPPYPRRRFVRAYGHGNRWIVWYEHGGLGYHLHAIGVIQSQKTARMDGNARYVGFDGEQLCAGSRAYFGGAQTSQEY